MSRKVKQPEQPDPTTAYARAVSAGEIVAGRPVRLACERHLRDLKEGNACGLRFDEAKAEDALEFFKPDLGRFQAVPSFVVRTRTCATDASYEKRVMSARNGRPS